MTTPPSSTEPGALTLKQGGIGLVIAAAVIAGANVATNARWEWGGVRVEYIAAAFGAVGVVVAIIGFATGK